MRSWATFLLVIASGCGADEIIPPASDGRTSDAPPVIDAAPGPDAATACSSPTGTASVATTGTGSGNQQYARLYAGALWLIGPVAPPAHGAASMTVTLLFTDQPMLDQSELVNCEVDDPSCTFDTLVGTTAELADGTEVGTHSVTFRRTIGPGFEVPATITITDFADPFTAEPGRVAGSIAADDAGRTITGTFDHTFCPAFLSATI
jgi:hypothetical protein